jgi:quinolinate synthase
MGLEFAIQKENTAQKNLNLHFARDDAICSMMKLITLEKIRDVMVNRPETNLVKVPDDIANGARKDIQRMLDLS